MEKASFQRVTIGRSLRPPVAADVVALLKLGPAQFLVENALDSSAGEAELIDDLEELMRGGARGQHAFDGMLALGLYFAGRTGAARMTSRHLIAELHLRPEVLFEAINTARVEAETGVLRLGAAIGGANRGKKNLKLKKFVLDAARAGGFSNPAAAAAAIAKRFGDESMAASELTLKAFEATLSHARIKKTFEGWIRADWSPEKTIST
jgi:hypothetical protein